MAVALRISSPLRRYKNHVSSSVDTCTYIPRWLSFILKPRWLIIRSKFVLPQRELREIFDDEEGGLRVPAQKMQYLAEVAHLRRIGVRSALTKVLQAAKDEQLNQEEEGGKDSISNR